MFTRKTPAAAFAAALIASSIAAGAACAAPPLALQWQHFPGTVATDLGQAAAIDAMGNVFIGGDTAGSLGRANQGSYDGFVVKYSPGGAVIWRRQPASTQGERVTALATDPADGVVAVGTTLGALAGPHRGSFDGFVVAYAADGTKRWARQFGTPSADEATAVAADATGDIVVAGSIGADGGINPDALVIRYAADGAEKWRRVLASPGDAYDAARGVATDADGNVAVVGYTSGALGGANHGIIDTFVALYSPTGTLKWIRQPGRADLDGAQGVAINTAGQIFVVGFQPGTTSAYEGYLAAYSSAGVEQWRRTVVKSDMPSDTGTWMGVTVDPAGRPLVAGLDLANVGAPFVASYTASGTLRWKQPLPQPPYGSFTSIYSATDVAGHLAIASTASRRPPRYQDAFIAKYDLAIP